MKKGDRMKTKLLLLVALMFLAGMASGAEPAVSPGARREYRIRYVDPKATDDLKDGRMWRISEFSLWTEDGSYEGKAAIVLKREERSTKGDRVLFEATVSADLHPYKTNRKIYTRQNKLLEESTTIYANHFYQFPARTIDSVEIPWVMERMDLTIGRPTDYWLAIGTGTEPWQVSMTPEAEETVTVPAGTFKCVKVKMKYSTDKLPGLLKILPKFIVGQFVTSPTGWVTKDTRVMVKYQDKLDGPGRPEKAEELVRIK
jgi:hypothetical protein